MNSTTLTPEILELLHEGTVIPAHPLALTKERNLDENHQRGLTRYYIGARAGGVAVGVHTTQFEIRKNSINLLEPALKLARDEIENTDLSHPFIRIAGVCGPTDQALSEAELAVKHGYHLGLVSMGGLNDWSNAELIERVEKIAEIIPVFGFYLQPAVGGQVLNYKFWKEFVEIPNVHAIKVAAFNRYQTLDVVRAVAESERRDEIALYTGNDDHIIEDLLTTFRFNIDGKRVEKRFVGGLLGHWAVWTSKAVELLDKIKQIDNNRIPACLLRLAAETTDANAAIFDAANGFKGCIPGIHEILRRQGLLQGRWCLNPDEVLSPGQMEEINRVYESYPYLTDDQFVEQHLDEFII